MKLQYTLEEIKSGTLKKTKPLGSHINLEGKAAKRRTISDSDSPLGKAYRTVTFNNDDYADKALDLGKQLNINPDILMRGGKDAIEKSIEIANQKRRINNTREFAEQYPELNNIRYKSEAEAIQVIKNAEAVNATKGAFDALQQGYMSMNDQMKLAQIGERLAEVSDELEEQRLIKEKERLENNLRNYRRPDSYMETIIQDTSAQFYMTGKQYVKGAAERGAEGIALGLGVGAVTGAVPGALVGAVSGFKVGADIGAAEQMYKMSFGNKFLELYEKRDALGNRLYTKEEAKKRAMAFATVDAAIEFGATKIGLKGLNKVVPVSTLAKIGGKSAAKTLSGGLGRAIGNTVKRSLIAGSSELIEEGLQDVNEKVQANLFGKEGDETYTAGEIGLGALGAMKDAIPAVLGMSILGAGYNAGATYKSYRDFKKLSPEQQKTIIQAEENNIGNNVLTSLADDSKNNVLAKANPSIYGRVTQAIADKQGVSNMYINAHEAVLTEEGQLALQDLLDKGVITQSEIDTSIENEVAIEVPLGSFAQVANQFEEATINALTETTQYSREGMSKYGIRHYQEMIKEMDESFKKQAEDKHLAKQETFIKTHLNELNDEEKIIASEFLGEDKEAATKNIYSTKQEIIDELWNNSEFEQLINDSYEENGKRGLKGDNAGFYETALEVAKEKAIADIKDTATPAALVEATFNLNKFEEPINRLKQLEKIEGAIDKISDRDFITANLSVEGAEVYDKVMETLKGSNNEIIRKQQKEAALLLASHAETFAEKAREAGVKDFKATDYLDNYLKIGVDGVYEGDEGFKQGYEKNLIAYHNISESNLKKAIELGTLAVPSIAVTNKDINYDDFGEISLIMNPNTVNPSETPVYTRDIWSDTFPKTYRKVDKEKLLKLHNETIKALEKENAEIAKHIKRSIGDISDETYIEDAERYGIDLEQALERFLNREAGKYFALKAIGKAPKLYRRTVGLNADIVNNNTIINALDSLEKSGVSENDIEGTKEYKTIIEELKKDLESKKDKLSDFAYRSRLRGLERKPKHYYEEYKKRNNKVWNYDRFDRAVEKNAKKYAKEVEAWKNKVKSEILGENLIKSTNKPITADNIVEAMLGGLINTQQTAVGLRDGNVIAASAEKINNLKDMHEIGDETIKENAIELKKQLVGKIQDYSIAAIKGTPANIEDALVVLIDMLKDGKTFKESAKDSVIRKEKAIESAANELVKEIQQLPTKYFEAKPQRAVNFNEVAAAIMPNNVDKSVKDYLEKEGVNIKLYDPKVEGDRQNKVKEVQEVDNVLFQKKKGHKKTRYKRKYAWNHRLDKDQESWENLVDIFVSGVKFNGPLKLMETPTVLSMLGVKRKPLEITKKVLTKVLFDKHGETISVNMIKRLPTELANPIFITDNYNFETDTVIANEMVIFVELYDNNGELINVALKLDVDDGYISVARIKTIFGRERILKYIKNVKKRNGFLYIDKKKTERLLLRHANSYSPLVNKRSVIKLNVPDENDLVKARMKENNEYYQDKATVNGLTSLYADDSKLLQLFDSADWSTFVHESGHVFLEDLRILASMEGASEQVKKDWEVIKSTYGYKEGASANENRKAHEDFARHFESWVRDGKAPNKLLHRIFHKFKNELVRIYKTLTSLGGSPTNEVKDVMARMVATQSSIESWSNENKLDSVAYAELFDDMGATEKDEIMKRLEDLKNGAYDEVRETYAAEFKSNQRKLWRKQKAKVKKEIELELGKKYDCYATRLMMAQLGDTALELSPYKTLENLEAAEEKALGTFKEAVANELEAAKEEFIKSDITEEEVYRLADEYMLTTEAHGKLIEAEVKALRKITNETISDTFNQLTKLKDLDVLSETFDDDLNKIKETPLQRLRRKKNERIAIEKEKRKEAVAKEREKKKEKVEQLKEEKREAVAKAKERSKEQIAEIKAKNEKKLQEVKAKLQERIKNARALRDVKIGTAKSHYEESLKKSLNMTISQAKSWKTYQNKMVSISKKVENAMAKGDLNEALAYKQKQLKTAGMTRVAYDIDKAVDKTLKKWKKLNKSISRTTNPIRVEPNARYLIQHLLYQLNITKKDGIEPLEGFSMDKVMALLDPDVEMESNDDNQSLYSLDDRLLALLDNGKDYKKLTVEEFGLVTELIQAVYSRGRYEYEANKILNERGEKVDFDTAAFEMLKEAALERTENNPLDTRNNLTTKEKAKNTVGSIMLPLTKVDVILKRLDGGEKGKWYRYLYDPIDKASSDLLKAQVENGKALKAIFDVYSRKELHEIRNERRYTIGNVTNMTKEEVMTLALNLGTEANRQRAAATVELPIESVEIEVGKILNGKDWDVIENIWKLINSYFKERSKVQERLYGVPIKKEKGYKFNVGERTIDGMYYPIVYDHTADSKSSDYAKEDIIKSQMASNAVWGMGMSATKKRNKVIKGKKLALDFNVITGALDEAVTHIHMREAVTEVNKLVNRADISSYLIDTLGTETYQYIKTWVRDCWQSEITKTTKLERWLNRLKHNATFSIMAYRLSTAALNVLNIVPMAERIGWLNTSGAFKEFYGSKVKDNWNFVISKSTMMANRNQTLDKDLMQALTIDGSGIEYKSKNEKTFSKAVDDVKAVKEKIDDYGFWLISKTDMMIGLPLWKYTYDMTVVDLMARDIKDPAVVDQLAITEADRAVREVFGSGETKDSVGIQRRNSFINIFTPFYTYCNTVLNAQISKYYVGKDTGNWTPLIMSIMHWIILQSILEYALRQGIKGLCGGDTDDIDDIPTGVLSSIIDTGVSGLPIARDIISSVASLAMGERIYSRGNEVQMLAIGGKIVDTLQNAKSDKKTWVDVGRSASQLSNRAFGFSDTITDGFWTLVQMLASDTDADIFNALSSILFDKKVK